MTVGADFPVAVVGAGPVGLAAAAHLTLNGLPFVILESGDSAGFALRQWGHVRMFSPWRYNIDQAARALLEKSGWTEPNPDHLPTGHELVHDYLTPLVEIPEFATNLLLGVQVTAIAREGFDKMGSSGREQAPFTVRYLDRDGVERNLLASAVIDASGTWSNPNPMGADGLPVVGELPASSHIGYRIPDVVGNAQEDYAGKRILVVGGGHSAINSVLALLELQKAAPTTRIVWALRHNRRDKLLGGAQNDKLPSRGALGMAAVEAINSRKLELLAPFRAHQIVMQAASLLVEAQVDGQPRALELDRIIVATGFRPDHSFLRELRIELDPTTEAPPALSPLIDPNFHSCGTVPPHGVDQLAHQEAGFFIVGSKSYGRAPTFLMATGYEQVRSVVAELAGHHDVARQVRLALPETGVCNALQKADTSQGCCGGPAPAEIDACCVADAAAKADGKSGCGCGSKRVQSESVEAAVNHDR